jgi:plasmid stability protein
VSTLQIKNLPDEVHAKLRDRARSQHLTVSAYVTRLLARDVGRPTTDEWLAGARLLRQHAPIDVEQLIDDVRDELESR